MHRMLLLDGVLYCPATLLSVLVRPHFLRAECAGLSMSCPVRHSLTCALSDFLPSGRDRLRPMHSNGLSDVLVCIITDMAFLVAKRWWELGFVYSKLHTIDCPNMGFRVWGHVGHSYLFFLRALGLGRNLLPSGARLRWKYHGCGATPYVLGYGAGVQDRSELSAYKSWGNLALLCIWEIVVFFALLAFPWCPHGT